MSILTLLLDRHPSNSRRNSSTLSDDSVLRSLAMGLHRAVPSFFIRPALRAIEVPEYSGICVAGICILIWVIFWLEF